MLLGHSEKKKEAKTDRVRKITEHVWANADATPYVWPKNKLADRY